MWVGGGGGGFFFQAEDGIRDSPVTGVQTCALPISDRNCELTPTNSSDVLEKFVSHHV